MFSLYSFSKNIILALLLFNMQNNSHDLCECKPQGMSKVVVFIALFAQASTLLRQSPRKLLLVCHETPYEGPWKNSVRLSHPPVAGKL